MDGHGDYNPLDRPRLLTAGLEGGANASGSSSAPGGGSVHLTVTELAARAATPTTLTTLAQYQSRYGLPPAALPGSNYAIMSSFFSGAHNTEARKALLPDLQHYWSTHTESFPRYLMAAGGIYQPYPPLFPPSESLSLLGAGMTCMSGGAGPSSSHHAVQYQRIIEMHTDAYLASMSAVAAANHHSALYGINPGGLPPFLDQSPAHAHGTSPISLVKQEPKEVTCPAEKLVQHPDRQLSLDMDYGRPGKEAGQGQSPHHMKGKISPSSSSSTSSSSSSSSLGSGGKLDHKATALSATPPSNSSHSLRKSSSANLSSTPRHQQEHLRTKCASPASSPATHSLAPGCPNNASSKKTKSSKQWKYLKPVERHQLIGGAADRNLSDRHLPIVTVPNPASAPIPLATVQHDGILLSALASPSSAAASLASSSKMSAVKQQQPQHMDRLNVTCAGPKEAIVPANNSSIACPASDRQPGKTFSSVSRHGSDATSEPGACSRTVPASDRLCSQSSAQEDNSEIVVDSTEEAFHVTTKSEQARAIEETIERVASAADEGTDTTRDSGPFPCQGRSSSSSSLVPPVMSVVKSDSTGTVSSSLSPGACRIVHAKTLNIPSVTVSGPMTSRNITTQANASALPFYHSRGVKRVHATTFVPEVGIFRGPTIKSFTRNVLSSSPAMVSSISLEDACNRPDPKCLQVNPLVSGHDRTTDHHTPSPTRVSLTPDLAPHGMTTGEISSSLDTASVGSPSVRSQSVTSNPSLRSQSVTSNPSLTDRDDYVIKEEFDDVSDDEANGLVIDDEADDNSHDANNDLVKNTAVEPKDSGGQVDKRNDAASDLQGEDPASVKSAAGESLPKRPCDDKKHAESLDVTVDTCTKLNNKVPSAEAGDTAPYIDKAIDYSLPKSLLFGCGSSKLSVNRKIDANLSSSLSACKQSSSVDKHHLGAQKKTSPPFRDFMSHSSSSVVVKNCRKLLKSSSSSSSGKLTSLACKPEKMVSQTPRHQACDKSTAKCQLIKDSPQHSPRCGSAPPIGASSSTLMSGGAAVCVSKGHVISIGDARCSKLSLDLQDRSEGSNEHSLGSNIPVGIAVAQIRPHHVQSTRDSQVSETHGRDVRLNSASVKAVPQCSQAESSETLPPSMVVTGRALNPASWLAQMPFTVHQSLNSSGTTFGPTHYPVTPPAGFKFTQDSITGQIYLVANGVETGVWPHSNFTSSSGTGHSHFQASNSLPSLNSSETKIGLAKEEVMPGVSDDTGVTDHILPHQPLTSADKNGATPDSVRQQVLTQQFKGGKVLPTPAFTSATTATALVNRVTGLNASAPFGDIKPSVQSRGCSPVQFEDSSSSLALLSTLSSLTSKRPSTCSIGIQTCSTLSQGSEKNISPAKIPLHDQGVQTLKSELSTLNPLSVQCPDLDSLETLIPKANTERSSYNPFTDPQILQAADGLELLSALAEKRPKCSSLDDHKRIFPSPSDSFKSDTASILALDDTLSPGDADLKSGQCTPRRDVRRDLSPKWSLPKKEQQTLAFGDFKAPTEMCSDSFEVRVKMAEVQRQYKEKQKKLAKLQIKKTEESHQNKRGPGRPPKKKPGSKKSDDDSSSSSSKTKEHSQHQQKKKRPAEELVDRVFRKLPPVKPCKVSRSIHYVKSKTGPFFKRKSASSSVKRNKDLFGFDESNWPSFSERKHQEKIKGSGVLSVGGNIFESFNKDYSEKRGRPAKTNSLKDTKLSTVSLLTVKTEPSQESGLGLLAKFALTSPTTQLTSPTSSLTLSATPCSSSPHVTVMSQLSTNTFSSSSGIYGGMYSSIYHVTNPSSTPTITFGSRSSLMSSANSGLMSFSSPGLSVSVKPATAIASSAQTCSVTSSLSQTSSGSLTTTVTWTASVSPSSANHSSSTEESSGTPCGSEASPHKRKQDEDSDTDTSESSPNKKRKPGRPKKINPDMSTGGTETIWAKKSSNLGLLQVTESNMGIKENDIKKLDVNIMKPLFLDEEWTRRRSERIFLSETSPQPSPAISPSPRGEPVWKLSNFMPKSKKILDVNKSVKDTDSKELIGSSQKSSSSCSSMPASNVLKTEDSLIPTLSAFSWSTLPNLPEPSPVKPEAEDTKDDETVWPQLNTTQKSKKNSEKQKVSSKDKDKKTCTEKTNKIVKCKLDVEEDQLPPVLIKKEKRAEEHSKIKLQKAKSLHDLTQRVKKKFSLANKKQDDQVKLKKGKKKRNSSTDSSDNDNLPLSAFRDGPPTPEPCSCKLQTTDLREGLKVLYLNDGLFYEGVVKALQPPDVYGVLTAGQRGSRPHILCQEEVLKDAVLDVRPGSIRYLPEGTRVCAFWSQQFSCLYPGTVAKSSPSAHATINVSVDFDDGDSGRIPIEHIRLLPADFPVVEYEPDPLENLPKRRRQTTSDSSDTRKPSETSKSNRNEKKQKEKEVNEDKSDSDESSVIVSSHKLWRWAGECTKRPGMKGKAKKIFYKSVSRGKEVITVGDSAVFVSTGRANCPFIGHIESLWQSWNGQMMVKVQWYYHPEETHSDKKLADPKNALFESHHEDENDVQTISHKCQVLNYADFKKKLSNASKKGKKLGPNVFYVAGFYDPSLKQLKFHSGVS